MADVTSHNVNRASELKSTDEEAYKDLALQITNWYKADRDARLQWDEKLDEYYKLSICEPLDRTPAIEGGANVCTPIIASAVLSFSARAYSSIVSTPDSNVVSVQPVEKNDVKNARTVEHFMNWQISSEMEEWEEGFDKSLHELATFGTVWRKITWLKEEQRPRVVNVPTVDVFVPYGCSCIEKSPRITQRLRMNVDDILENEDYQNNRDLKPAGMFLEEEDTSIVTETSDEISGNSPPMYQDESIDRNTVLEAHVLMRIPEFGDTKREPYTITVDVPNQEILRLVSRKGPNGKTIHHWIDYHFIPNSQGFYSFGYGAYLHQLNNIQNTIYNLAIDSGRLSNTPFILYGRGAGLKGRNLQLRPGVGLQVSDVNEVREIKLPGLDNAIIPLMQQTEKFGQDISSNAEELQGRGQRGIREPTASGTQMRIEQGLTQFSVLTKRVLRSLKRELRLLFQFNAMFLTNEKTFRVVGRTDATAFDFQKLSPNNLDGKYDIKPTGDPAFASPIERKNEALTIMNTMLQNPLIVGMQGMLPPNFAAMRKGLENFLVEFERSDIINSLPSAPEPSIPPEEELELLIEGEEVAPKRGEDHVMHLAKHVAFVRTEDFARLNTEQKMRIQNHILMTEALAEQETEELIRLQNAQAMFIANSQITGGGNGGSQQGGGSGMA